MFLAAHICFRIFGHNRDADFPEMALRSNKHQLRDCPIPPPRRAELVVQDRLVMGSCIKVNCLAIRKLRFQGLGRDPDAHRRQFRGAACNEFQLKFAFQPMRVFAGLVVMSVTPGRRNRRRASRVDSRPQRPANADK